MKRLKFTALFTGILIIGALLVGAIIYMIHQRTDINTLRYQSLFAHIPSETAYRTPANKEAFSALPIEPNVYAGKRPTGFAVNRHQQANKNFEPKKDSSKGAFYYMIATSIKRDFPELHLSDEEVEELSQIIIRLRETIQGFRDFDHTEGNYTDFRQLEDQRDDALWNFELITGMSFVEFLNRAPSDGGIDNEESDRKKSMLEAYLDSGQP